MTDHPAEELALSSHSSPADGTEFTGRPVEGADLSRLLGAFDPPLPTDVQKPLLVGLGGFKESGKDTVAMHWADRGEKNFARLMMSDPLVEVGRAQNPWILLDRNVTIDWGEDYNHGTTTYLQGTWVKLNVLTEALGYDGSKAIREVRVYYQTLGQQVGREIFGADVWVDLALREINSWRDAGRPVAITGIRYPNEIEMIKRLGGHTVWVDRPGLVSDGHASESSLSKEDFDFVLMNDRDLPQLYRRADHLLTLLG